MNAFWILVLLILVSGFFALSEMALASSRRSKLQAMADAGNHKAGIALDIMGNPSRLLAATQTGITAAALLMGIYGESALTATFQHYIDLYFPTLTDWADTISFAVTIALVTGFSIIVGEIVPKRLAIANPRLAPYGAAAMEVLTTLNLADAVRGKLVQGENIAQTYQFIASGNAGLGFVALSQVAPPGKPMVGSIWLVPEGLYSPIRQDAVLLNKGQGNAAAAALLSFLKGDKAQALIRAYGYGL